MSLHETESEFSLTSPADIRAALFELNHPDSRIGVRDAGGRDIAVELIGVDRSAPYFYWRPRDFAGNDFAHADERGLLAADDFRFVAQGYGGVLIRFAVARPELVRSDDGQPALASPFPHRMTRIQRRRTFRAGPRGGLDATARWLPEGGVQPVQMTLRDISVDGVGLRVAQPLIMLPPVGATLRAVALDLGEEDPLIADLQVRSAYALGRQDEPGADGQAAEGGPGLGAAAATPWAQPLSHLGTVFVGLNKRQESWLQQVVWRLEKSRSSH